MDASRMRTDKTALRRLVSTILLLTVIGVVTIQESMSISSPTVTSVSPTSTTITASPVTLSVVYVDGNGIAFPNVTTFFQVKVPGDSDFRPVGYAGASSDGHASMTFAPPVAGVYQWRVNATWPLNDTAWTSQIFPSSGYWTFTCAITTSTSTSIRYSWTTQTVTVGVVTSYSYLYLTQNQYFTAYSTRTMSLTSTMRLTSTITASTTVVWTPLE